MLVTLLVVSDHRPRALPNAKLASAFSPGVGLNAIDSPDLRTVQLPFRGSRRVPYSKTSTGFFGYMARRILHEGDQTGYESSTRPHVQSGSKLFTSRSIPLYSYRPSLGPESAGSYPRPLGGALIHHRKRERLHGHRPLPLLSQARIPRIREDGALQGDRSRKELYLGLRGVSRAGQGPRGRDR